MEGTYRAGEMKNLYYESPSVIKNLLVSAKAYSLNKRKYGTVFNQFFNSLVNEKNDTKYNATDELNRFIDYAKYNIDFYKNCSDIYSSPVIDKTRVKKNYSAIKNGKPSYIISSSGTTGQPLKVPYSSEALQKEYAFWWYHRSFCGVKRGDRIATIAGHKVIDVRNKRPPFWVYNKADNQVIFSSYHLSEYNLQYYIEELNRFKPLFIHGYPSSIYLFAHYILANNSVLNFRPNMIVASSETLLNFQRLAIEKAFGSKVYIWYGNTEQCGHITECEWGKLHIQPLHSYVRIMNAKNQDVKLGARGCIVATNFLNRCFPLINYNTGDFVTLSVDQSCKCGRPGQIVEQIDGRLEDYIVLPDKRLIGRLDHIFKKAMHVKMAQIEQYKPAEIIVHIVKEPHFNAHEEKEILRELRSRVGDEIVISFDYPAFIEMTRQIKYRFIIQHINLANYN
jgi:phenylacetate-CoA ligase